MENETIFYQILEELKTSLNILTSSPLGTIIDENKDDLETLYKKIRKYNTELSLETESEDNDDEDIDEDGKPKVKKYFSFRFNINGVLIDPSDFSRAQKVQFYDYKKQKIIHKIRIFKKYPSPDEYLFDIDFLSEEERDFWLDVLRTKLKNAGIKIL